MKISSIFVAFLENMNFNVKSAILAFQGLSEDFMNLLSKSIEVLEFYISTSKGTFFKKENLALHSYIKVSKSQKIFLLKLNCPTNERNIW